MTLRTQNTVPETYDEVFRHYYPQILGLVKQFGITPQRREDVAMMILTKFIERDALHDFDPQFIGRNGSPMRFQSFLSGFVVAYVRHWRSREIIEANREMNLVDQPSSHSQEEDRDGHTWIDENFSHEDDLSSVEMDLMMAKVRRHLATLPATNENHDLALLFDFVMEQINSQGRILVTELADLYGVSISSMQTWIRRLRDQIRMVLS